MSPYFSFSKNFRHSIIFFTSKTCISFGGVKLLGILGHMTVLNPSLALSTIRDSIPGTRRTSPESPTSPKMTVSAGISFSVRELKMAAIIARSAEGSWTFSPPTTLR